MDGWPEKTPRDKREFVGREIGIQKAKCRFIGITISRRLDYIGKLRGFAASGVRPMPILMVMTSDKDISGGAAVFVKTPGAPAIPLLSNIWLSLPTPASVSYVSALRY